MGVLVLFLIGTAIPSKAALMFTESDANLSFSFFGFDNIISGTSIGFLVADTGGDGFVGFGDGASSDLLGATSLGRGDQLGDDLILGKFTGISAAGTTGFDSNGNLSLDYGVGGLAANQALGLLYFTDGSDSGDAYHFYRSDAVTDPGINGTSPYLTPTMGETGRIVSVRDTISIGVAGSVSQSSVVSAAVPEPSAALLSGILMWLGMIERFSRRRAMAERGQMGRRP